METHTDPQALEPLARLLGRELLLAELVVFKLVELRGLLEAGEARFLPWAGEEVERATAALRDAELQRGVVVGGLAEARGLDPDAPLSALLEGAPEPWRTLLADDGERLTALCTEARDLVAAGARLAETGLRGVEQLLGRATGAPAPDEDDPRLYGPAGRRSPALPHARVHQTL